MERDGGAHVQGAHPVPPTDGQEEQLAGLHHGLQDGGLAVEREARRVRGRRVHRAEGAMARVHEVALEGRHQPHVLAAHHLSQQHVHVVMVQRGDGARRAQQQRRHVRTQLRVDDARGRADVLAQPGQAVALPVLVARHHVEVVRLAARLHHVHVFTQPHHLTVLVGLRGVVRVGVAPGHDFHLHVPEALPEVRQRPAAHRRPVLHEALQHHRPVAEVVAREELLWRHAPALLQPHLARLAVQLRVEVRQRLQPLVAPANPPRRHHVGVRLGRGNLPLRQRRLHARVHQHLLRVLRAHAQGEVLRQPGVPFHCQPRIFPAHSELREFRVACRPVRCTGLARVMIRTVRVVRITHVCFQPKPTTRCERS